jgi:hypothetical protein
MRPAPPRRILPRSPRFPLKGETAGLYRYGAVSIEVSRRFDAWVSASVGLAAAAGPLRRWRPHPSNPLVRRRVPLALDEREYKADGTLLEELIQHILGHPRVWLARCDEVADTLRPALRAEAGG